MPLKVTFELSDRDVRYFKKTLSEVAKRSEGRSDAATLRSAKKLIHEFPEDAPEFVRERAHQLSKLIDMLEDDEWQLKGADRKRVLTALAYFADPHDLIPDTVPGLGYLDDAIMVELVVQELRHEIEAYDDFCSFRSEKDEQIDKGQGSPEFREEWIQSRREQLQARMRRRRRRRRSAASHRTASGRSPTALW